MKGIGHIVMWCAHWRFSCHRSLVWGGPQGRAKTAVLERPGRPCKTRQLMDAERYAAFFRGTLAPFRLASDNPMAIACLRFFTRFLLLPLVSVPFFRLCIVRFTDF